MQGLLVAQLLTSLLVEQRVVMVSRLGLNVSKFWVRFQAEVEVFLFSVVSQSTLGIPSLLFSWKRGQNSQGVKVTSF
jgi:hypothetical protein